MFAFLLACVALAHAAAHGNSSVNVVIVTVGRTGSTLLSDILGKRNNSCRPLLITLTDALDLTAHLPSSYAFMEPYGQFRTGGHTGPTYRELLTCSLFQDPVLSRAVLWQYECLNDPTLDTFPELKSRCINGNLTDKDLHKLEIACRKAQYRVVKTIRFERHHDLEGVNQGNLRVIYLARDPWDVFRSQYTLGWVKGDDSMEASERIMETAQHVCAQILNSYATLRSVVTENSVRIGRRVCVV